MLPERLYGQSTAITWYYDTRGECLSHMCRVVSFYGQHWALHHLPRQCAQYQIRCLCLSSPEDDILYLQCLLPNQWSYERLCATTAMTMTRPPNHDNAAFHNLRPLKTGQDFSTIRSIRPLHPNSLLRVHNLQQVCQRVRLTQASTQQHGYPGRVWCYPHWGFGLCYVVWRNNSSDLCVFHALLRA